MKKILYILLLSIFSTTVLFAQTNCSLTVKATPLDSQIKIMNIKPKYYHGIPLTCEFHEILVEKSGYIPVRQWIKVNHPNSFTEVILEKPSPSNFEAIKAGDFEHKEKTLGLLDAIFQNKQVDYLDKISTFRFQKSNWYKTLQRDISSSSYRINFNHSSEIAIQEFLINGKENHVLIVNFEKSKQTNLWYIADAYEKKWNKIKYFREFGFKPLEFITNFSDLVKKIKRGQIEIYYGLAPRGKLNSDFFQSKKLSLSRDKSIKIKDIIIHDGNQIRDIIFLTLKYYPVGHKEGKNYKSGWLLDDGGSMSSIYKAGENLYLDIFFRKQNLNLNAKNKGLIYFNLKKSNDNQKSIRKSENSIYKEAPNK